MTEQPKTLPAWFPYLDLGCAVAAGGLLYALPQLGPWPLDLALAPWMVRLGVTGRLTRRTPYDIPLVLFMLTAGIGVWAAYDRGVAWPKFCLVVGGVFLFYALVNAKPIGDLRVWLLAFFGAGVALYFLATHDWQGQPAKIRALTGLGQAVQAALPSLPGHGLHPNIAGGLIAMMLPFAGLAVLQAWRRIRAAARPRSLRFWLALVIALGLLALTSFGLLMTTSRGAWLGLAAALSTAGLWIVSRWLARGHAIRQAWIFPSLLVLGLVAILAVGVAWPQVIVAVVGALPGPDTSLSRAELLRNSLILIRDYPFLGAGLGSFPMLYSSYAYLLHVVYIAHAHNVFVDVTIEQGVPALLLLIWMWILFAEIVGATLRGFPFWREKTHPAARLGSAAMGAAALSLVVILVHGLVDDPLYSRHGALLLFVPLAFGVPLSEESSRRASRWLPLALPIGIGLLAILALIGSKPVLSLISSNLGAVHQSQAELSVYTWPEWPVQDAVRRAVDLSRPIAEFERALAWDSRNSTANRRLGMIELSLGEYQSALGYLEAAYAAEPGSVTTRQLLGEALIVNGRVEEGQALWAEVAGRQGQLELRAAWYRYIHDSKRAKWIEQAAHSR
jgi:O-antigen ligase